MTFKGPHFSAYHLASFPTYLVPDYYSGTSLTKRFLAYLSQHSFMSVEVK